MNQVCGEVITFYSYKGGSGRSMALANIGCLLAREGKRVLIVDWDLDAPGLHRFFERYSMGTGQRAFDEWVASAPGLIELLDVLFAGAQNSSQPFGDGRSAPFEDVDLARYCVTTDIERLWLLKAGRFDGEYPNRVASMNWGSRYKQWPGFFQGFSEWLAKDFDYVLIDSRTGVSDISGICTALIPEKLVLVFTPTAQSISGGIEVMERSARFRLNSDDLRSYIVYPLPSRIETSELELLRAWSGRYREEFEKCFRRLYDLDRCDLSSYFEKVQIQQVGRYAYGEEIAVLAENQANRLSLSRSYYVFMKWLTSRAPWEEQPVEQPPEQPPDQIR
jgi:eukaryotic-like serine/threonine-protein kinase